MAGGKVSQKETVEGIVKKLEESLQGEGWRRVVLKYYPDVYLEIVCRPDNTCSLVMRTTSVKNSIVIPDEDTIRAMKYILDEYEKWSNVRKTAIWQFLEKYRPPRKSKRVSALW